MIIQTDNLWKKYGRFGALRGLTLNVPEGSAFALLGANGAGKTTEARETNCRCLHFGGKVRRLRSR